jgi:serine/threonine-protein kinase
MLAEGGMADVYLAVTQNAGFEKLVVIKQLRESLAEDPTFVAMFMDEARLAARLNHPNVVQTLEVGTDVATGLHFIAMEFLEGVAYVRLARLKDRIPPPLAFHLRIIVDILRGLHYAHELCDFDGKPLSVVHRDVSPQNVMLTFAGMVKVLDFGIAKAELAVEQRPEDFKGKLEYMAPEQALRQPVDRRADIFSVGVMLFEALTRRRLYQKGDQKHELLVSGRLPGVLDVTPSAPKHLAAICAKAMAHDREDRYATADAMADELEDWLGNTTQHVSARDVGSFVAEKFAATRAKISAAIEAQLALFQSLKEVVPNTLPLSRLPVTDVPAADASDPPPAPMSIPQALLPAFSQNDPGMPMGELGGPTGTQPGTSPMPAWSVPGHPVYPSQSMPAQPAYPSHPGMAAHPAFPSGPMPVQAAMPASIPAQPVAPPVHGSPLPSASQSQPIPTVVVAPGDYRPPNAVYSGSHVAVTIGAQRVERPVTGPRPAVVAAITFFAVLFVGGGVVLATRGKSGKTTARGAATSTSVSTTSSTRASGSTPAAILPSPPIEEAQVEITMKASPSEARIFLDGTPIPTNPATAKRPRDGAIHLIRIEAPGFEPREESLGFDRSVYLNIELHPLGSVPAPTIVSPGPNPGMAPDTTPTPRNRAKAGSSSGGSSHSPRPRGSSKPIDSENPY